MHLAKVTNKWTAALSVLRKCILSIGLFILPCFINSCNWNLLVSQLNSKIPKCIYAMVMYRITNKLAKYQLQRLLYNFILLFIIPYYLSTTELTYFWISCFLRYFNKFFLYKVVNPWSKIFSINSYCIIW